MAASLFFVSSLSMTVLFGQRLDVSSCGLVAHDACEIADGLCANAAMASVNILSNNIGAEQANKLIAIMASKPNLTTLCGFSGDETELDRKPLLCSASK